MCKGLNDDPKHGHVPIPRTCKYVTLHDKKGLCRWDLVKDMQVGDALQRTPSDWKEEGRVSSGCDRGAEVEMIRGRGHGPRSVGTSKKGQSLPPHRVPNSPASSPWSDSIPGIDGHKFAPAEEPGLLLTCSEVATQQVKTRMSCHDLVLIMSTCIEEAGEGYLHVPYGFSQCPPGG